MKIFHSCNYESIEKKRFMFKFSDKFDNDFRETLKLVAESDRQKKLRSDPRYKLYKKYRKPIILSLLCIFVYWYFNPHGIFVLADPLSVYRYRVVLSDLKREMPEEYELVKNHIAQISVPYVIFGRNVAGLAYRLEGGKNRVRLLENTFVQGPGYAHSVLVHEACHGLQYARNLPFRETFCDHQSREHACNEWGIKVLKKFKGEEKTIKYYEGISQGNTIYGNSCERNGTLEKMPEL